MASLDDAFSDGFAPRKAAFERMSRLHLLLKQAMDELTVSRRGRRCSLSVWLAAPSPRAFPRATMQDPADAEFQRLAALQTKTCQRMAKLMAAMAATRL